MIFKCLLTLALVSGFYGPLTAQAEPLEKQYIELTPRAQKIKIAGTYPLLNELEPILKAVVKVRELPLKHPIKVDVLNRKELLKNLTSQVEKNITPDELEGEKALYLRWKMLPVHFKYKEFLLGLYTEQIGGFYDAKTKVLYLIQGVPLGKLDMEVLVAHELTHALQDQSFDLEKKMAVSRDKEKNDDQTLAIMAIVEGDAMLSSEEYMRQKTKTKPLSFGDIWGSVVGMFRMRTSFQKLNASPDFIKNGMIFPYTKGRDFIAYFRYTEGWSWDDISIFYQTLPESTEHILHPHKYLDGESPSSLKFNLPPLKYRDLLLSGTLGELGWQAFFKAHTEGSRESKELASGWNGDHYQVHKLSSGKYTIDILSHWDSQADAHAFFEAYKKTILKRFPHAKHIKDTAQEHHFQIGPNEQIILLLNSDKVWLSEGLRNYSNHFLNFVQAQLK